MNRFDAWTVHLATILVGGSGLGYAWMLYLLEPSDPFSAVNHPLQPTVQGLHVWTAPLLVFGAGLIWRSHVWRHYREGVSRGRSSGVAMLANLVPMVISGYLLQTAVSPGWRRAWLVIHLATAALWLAGYLLHLRLPLERFQRLVRRRRAGRTAPSTTV